jgi:hypothetical protein
MTSGRLVANHNRNQYNKYSRLTEIHRQHYAEIRKLEGHLEGTEFQHVSHKNNVVADVLSKLGSKQALVLAGVFVQDLRKPSIKLLDPDNPGGGQHDPTPVPPSDVLMTEKEND